MVEFYSVGPDVLLADYDLNEIRKDEAIRWAVYWYAQGYYDGSGEMAYFKDEKLYVLSLSHCSCYGPMEYFGSNLTEVALDEFFRDKDDIWDKDCKEAVKSKVRELLKG